ncbi:hypothetical protein Ciccas_006975 [Cichlidogyrus casuarinus]|uniref:Armadillo repeat-containing protein 6 n=1 Tax=Cichlidogyrus casuarinus TaxID=1844966 RepID=A0ABD2Q467_9PLAT
MTKTISQEAFNEQVVENQEIFECELEEAIKETIDSLTAQGVSLLNVIPEYAKFGSKNDPISLSLEAIGSLDLHDKRKDLDSFISELKKGLNYQVRAGSKNAPKLLIQLILDPKYDATTRLLSSEALIQVIQYQPDLATHDLLSQLLCSMKNSVINSIPETDLQLIKNEFRILELSCTKHEANRAFVANSGILQQTVAMVSARKTADLVAQACRLLKVITLDDDIRVEFGKGNEFANLLATDTKMIEEFSDIIRENPDSDYVCDMLEVVACALVREEYCLRFLARDGLSVVFALLQQHSNDKVFLFSCFRLLHNLCRSDHGKRALTKWNIDSNSSKQSGAMYPACELVMELAQQNLKEPILVRSACLLISHASLRQPDIAKSFVFAGAPSFLAKGLELYLKNAAVVRPVCMAIRNCVARTPELRPYFVPVEAIVQTDYKASPVPDANPENLQIEQNLNLAISEPDCSDEVKSALRDLGCKVQLKELWTSSESKFIP